jgi:type IV pilus biogenesis protein CpaD/CtpE
MVIVAELQGCASPDSGLRGSAFVARTMRHPPLKAGAEVDQGVDVVVTESHGNRAAWMVRLVGYLVSVSSPRRDAIQLLRLSPSSALNSTNLR